MKRSLLFSLSLLIFMSMSCAKNSDKMTVVRFETSAGSITVKLYPETSKHRDNFIKLVTSGFYDGVLFHRVIANFMVQLGDPESKTAVASATLGGGDVGYTIPAEFVYPQYYHKRGALAAARKPDQMNPQKASSGCQFYIVQGRILTDEELNTIESNHVMKLEAKLFQEILSIKQDEVRKYKLEKSQPKLDALRDAILVEVHNRMKVTPGFKFTPQQHTDYKTLGGTPHLDGEYTVFGEVIEGMDIVDKISKVQTGKADRPLEDIKVIIAMIVE